MKIFVAKLGFDTRADDLVALFSRFGKVDSAKVIMDRGTNRSKCYGFIEMPNEIEACIAVTKLNESFFQGSNLNVKESRSEPSKYYI